MGKMVVLYDPNAATFEKHTIIEEREYQDQCIAEAVQARMNNKEENERVVSKTWLWQEKYLAMADGLGTNRMDVYFVEVVTLILRASVGWNARTEGKIINRALACNK